MRGVPSKWLESYLNESTQFVGLSNARLEEWRLTFGVPQVSIFILASLSDLKHGCWLISTTRITHAVTFAEDRTFLFQCKDKLKQLIFTKLNSIFQWAQSLNKSKKILFHSILFVRKDFNQTQSVEWWLTWKLKKWIWQNCLEYIMINGWLGIHLLIVPARNYPETHM